MLPVKGRRRNYRALIHRRRPLFIERRPPGQRVAAHAPGKAASVANWVRVYERAARAKFSPEAKASLDLATRNLNNNLGTDLTLSDVLKGP